VELSLYYNRRLKEANIANNKGKRGAAKDKKEHSAKEVLL